MTLTIEPGMVLGQLIIHNGDRPKLVEDAKDSSERHVGMQQMKLAWFKKRPEATRAAQDDEEERGVLPSKKGSSIHIPATNRFY